MSLRVNLLKEEEYRYQGPVSLRFALLASGGLILAILLLAGATLLQRRLSLKHSINEAQEEWTRIEGRYGQVTAKQKLLNNNNALLNELKPWADSRPNWSLLLPALQRRVPASAQLTRLSIRSDWIFLKPEIPPTPDSATKATATPPPPATPARKFTITAEGRILGERSEDVVLAFVKELRDDPAFSPYVQSMNLMRFQRASEQDSGDARDFTVSGEFNLRKLQP